MAKPTFSLPVIMDARTTKKLLDEEVNRYGGLIYDGSIAAASDPALAQQVADDVAASASAAQQSADDAKTYGNPRFLTVADLRASTRTTFGGSGSIVEAEGYLYEEVPSGGDIVTLGDGVNSAELKVLDASDPRAFGFSPSDALNGPTLTALQNIAGYQAAGNRLAEYDQAPWRQMAQKLWQSVDQGVDFSIIIKGDSTGNSPFEWPRVLTGLLAKAIPTHTVKYRLFTEAGGWGAVETVQTGTGDGVIVIHNASIPGATDRAFQGAIGDQVDSAIPGDGYDAQITSFGHNGSSIAAATEDVWRERHMEGMCALKARHPNAILCATQQNPRFDAADPVLFEVSSNSARAMSDVCRTLGIGMLSIFDAFLQLGDFTPLMSDATHPNDNGMELWAGLAFLALRKPRLMSLYSGAQADDFYRENSLVRNPFFAVPEEEGAPLPAGYRQTGLTITRDTTYTDEGPWTLKLVSDGSASTPELIYDVPNQIVKRLRGKWVTFSVRARYLDDVSARMLIITNSSFSSNRPPNGGEGEGGFTTISVSHKVGATAVNMTFRYRCGTSNAAGSTAWLTWMAGREGLVPGKPNESGHPVKADGYLFDAANVGIVAAFDGTASVSGNDITVSGQTAPTRLYVNLPKNIPAGTPLVASWNGANLSATQAVECFVRGPDGDGENFGRLDARKGAVRFSAKDAQMGLMFTIAGTDTETFKDFTIDYA